MFSVTAPGADAVMDACIDSQKRHAFENGFDYLCLAPPALGDHADAVRSWLKYPVLLGGLELGYDEVIFVAPEFEIDVGARDISARAGSEIAGIFSAVAADGNGDTRLILVRNGPRFRDAISAIARSAGNPPRSVTMQARWNETCHFNSELRESPLFGALDVEFDGKSRIRSVSGNTETEDPPATTDRFRFYMDLNSTYAALVESTRFLPLLPWELVNNAGRLGGFDIPARKIPAQNPAENAVPFQIGGGLVDGTAADGPATFAAQLSEQDAQSVHVFRWLPASGSNFGDMIGPMIVERMLRRAHAPAVIHPVTSGMAKVLCVGSVLHFAEAGDIVWGSGVNGKTWLPARLANIDLKIAAVRGPISRAALLSVGQEAPEIYGDPGLLFPLLFRQEIETEACRIRDYYNHFGAAPPETVFIPNINDERNYFPDALNLPPHWGVIDTGSDAINVAAQIYLAKRVVSSSLHGLVFGDALAKECVYFGSRFEPTLKYEDYLLGTDRGNVVPAQNLSDDMETNLAPLKFDMKPLLDAFPFHLIGSVKSQTKVGHALSFENTEIEKPGSLAFKLEDFLHFRGWSKADGAGRAGQNSIDNSCEIVINRSLSAAIRHITLYFGWLNPEIDHSVAHVTIDGQQFSALINRKGDAAFLRLDMSSQDAGKTSPCRIEIRLGEENSAGRENASIAVVRKIGAALY